VAEKTESPSDAAPEETGPAYVSDQLAVKTWSVLARDLQEGGAVVLLHKTWDPAHDAFVVFPSYSGQRAEQIDPDVWTMWRHELKPPRAGHTRIRDYAEVAATFAIEDDRALAAIEGEFGLSLAEAKRRLADGEPGLVAVVVRVYALARTYKFDDVAEREGDALTVPLPFDVEIEDRTPAIEDEAFERRLARIKTAITGETDARSEPVERLVPIVSDNGHTEPLASTYKKYAGILAILATFTVGMIFIGESSMPAVPQAILLLLGSAIKASLIIFFFMHLKFEKMGLIMVVMIGIFVTSILMFVIPAYDGGHILENSLYK